MPAKLNISGQRFGSEGRTGKGVMEDTPSEELLEMEKMGWKFNRKEDGTQEWFLPTAFMKPVCFEDAVKLHRIIKNW
jgi:hypothetical protein